MSNYKKRYNTVFDEERQANQQNSGVSNAPNIHQAPPNISNTPNIGGQRPSVPPPQHVPNAPNLGGNTRPSVPPTNRPQNVPPSNNPYSAPPNTHNAPNMGGHQPANYPQGQPHAVPQRMPVTQQASQQQHQQSQNQNTTSQNQNSTPQERQKRPVLLADYDANDFAFYQKKENWIYLWAERSDRMGNLRDGDKAFKSQEIFDYENTRGENYKKSANAFMQLGAFHGNYSKDSTYNIKDKDIHIEYYEDGEVKRLSGMSAFAYLARNANTQQGQKGLITNCSTAMNKVMGELLDMNKMPRVVADLNVLYNAGMVGYDILDAKVDDLSKVWACAEEYTARTQKVTNNLPLFTLPVNQQTLRYTSEVARMASMACLTVKRPQVTSDRYRADASRLLIKSIDVIGDIGRCQERLYLAEKEYYKEQGYDKKQMYYKRQGFYESMTDIANSADNMNKKDLSSFFYNGGSQLLGYVNDKNNLNAPPPFHQFIENHLPKRVRQFMGESGLVGYFSQRKSPKSRFIKAWSKENDMFGLNEDEKEMMANLQTLMSHKEEYQSLKKVSSELKAMSKMMVGRREDALAIVQNPQGTTTGRQTGLNQNINMLGLNKTTKNLIELADVYQEHEIFNADVKGLEMVITNCAVGNVEGHLLYCQGGDNYLKTGLDIAMHAKQEMSVGNGRYPFAQVIQQPDLFHAKMQEMRITQEQVQEYQNSGDVIQARLKLMYEHSNKVREEGNHRDLQDIEQIRKVGKVASLMMNYGAGAPLIAREWDMGIDEVEDIKRAYNQCMDNRIVNIHRSLDDLLDKITSPNEYPHLLISKEGNKEGHLHPAFLDSKSIRNHLDADYLNGTHEAPTLVSFRQNKNPRELRLNFVGGGYIVLKDLKKVVDSRTNKPHYEYTTDEGEQKRIYGAQLFAFCIQGTGARCMQNQDVAIRHALDSHGVTSQVKDKRVQKALDIHDSKAFVLPKDETLKQASIMLIQQVMSEAGAGFERTFSHISQDEFGRKIAQVSTNRLGNTSVFRTDVDIGKKLESERTATHDQFLKGELEQDLLNKRDEEGNHLFKYRISTHLVDVNNNPYSKQGERLESTPEQAPIVLMRDLTFERYKKTMNEMEERIRKNQEASRAQAKQATQQTQQNPNQQVTLSRPII